MTAHAARPRRTHPLAPLLLLGLLLASIAAVSLAVVVDRRLDQVASAGLIAVLLGLAAARHRTLLAWPNVIAATALVILLIPIRREAQFSNLPFALEPYRVLVALVLGAWVAALLVDRRVRLRSSFVDAPLVAILGATAGSVVANTGRIERLNVEGGVGKALSFLVGFFLLLWLIVSAVRRVDDIRLIVGALVGAGAVITAFSLVEARTGYSMFDKLARALPGSGRATAPDPTIVLPTRGGRFRIFGSAQHPIELSAIMAMLVPLGLYMATSTRRLRWWLALALVFVGALASLSRTGILMLAVVVGVYLWLRPGKTVTFWPLVVPGIVLVHVAAPGALRELLASFFPAGGLLAEQQEANVGSGRLASLGPGLDEIAQRPVFGGGYGSRVVLGPDANSIIVDNMWLALGMQIGILGVAAWVWLFARFIRRTARLAKDDSTDIGWLATSLTAGVFAYAVGMLTFDTLSFIQVTFLLVILLGLGTALVSSVASPRPLLLPDPTGAGRTAAPEPTRTASTRERTTGKK